MSPAERAAFLDSILTSSTEYSIIAADLDGRIVSWNEGARRIYGYDAGEVLGKDLATLHSPDSLNAGRPQQIRDAARAEGAWSGEVVRRRKDGSLFTALLTMTARRDSDGRLCGFTLISRNISEQKEVLSRLEWLSLVVEQSPIAVVMTDVGGTIEYVNPAFTVNTGYSAAEVVGKNPRVLKSGDTPAEVYRDLWTTILDGRVWRGELANRRKDGTRYTDAMWVYPIKDSSGRVTRMLALKEDVSRQRSLEEQLRQAQRMESIGRLAGGVAHDFNNILTAIFGYSELMAERFAPGTLERDDLDEIRKAAQRASGLTRQLLAFSRQQVLQPVVFDPNDLVENLQKMLGRMIGEDINLVLSLGADIGNIRADPGQVEQVLMNLAVNARDAMPRGGALLIETSNVVLDERYVVEHQVVLPGPYVLIAVSDTGTGIPSEVVTRIFEPFYTTKEIGKGTGLGLSTVYGIVKQSGGYIWVYSEVGKGTTFKVYLPRVDAPPDPGVSAGKPDQLSGTETILLAEDDETLRALTKNVLAKLGYRVLDAANPAVALAVAEGHEGPIHLLLTDVVMPGASGRELAWQIAKTRPETKVLFISGYTGEAMIQHGLLDPGLNYLQKPYTPTLLATRVREVLSRA